MAQDHKSRTHWVSITDIYNGTQDQASLSPSKSLHARLNFSRLTGIHLLQSGYDSDASVSDEEVPDLVRQRFDDNGDAIVYHDLTKTEARLWGQQIGTQATESNTTHTDLFDLPFDPDFGQEEDELAQSKDHNIFLSPILMLHPHLLRFQMPSRTEQPNCHLLMLMDSLLYNPNAIASATRERRRRKNRRDKCLC